MPTPDEQKKLDHFGKTMGEGLRQQMGHRWALSVLLTALTHVIGAILHNEKLTYTELFERIDNAVATWKLAFTPTTLAMDETGTPPDGKVVKLKVTKPKSTKVH